MHSRHWLYAMLLVSALGFTTQVRADEVAAEKRPWQGYGYFGAGARPADDQGVLDIGAGVQRFIGNSGFALGAEANSFGFVGCWSCGAFVVSAIVAYEWRTNLTERKLSPFVDIGAGVAAAGGGVGIFSAGAGANYWLTDRVAVRFGVHGDFTAEGDSYAYFRGGITF
jgi:hypothetical protein